MAGRFFKVFKDMYNLRGSCLCDSGSINYFRFIFGQKYFFYRRLLYGILDIFGLISDLEFLHTTLLLRFAVVHFHRSFCKLEIF